MKKRVILVVQGLIVEGDLPEGSTMEGVQKSLRKGEFVVLRDVSFPASPAIKRLPELQINGEMVGASGAVAKETGRSATPAGSTASGALAAMQAGVDVMKKRKK